MPGQKITIQTRAVVSQMLKGQGRGPLNLGLPVNIAWSAVFWFALSVLPGLANAGPVATDARLKGDQTSTAFELVLSEGTAVEVFTLAAPYRVIIDLPDVVFQLKPETGTVAQGLVNAFRYGQFAERKARVVIDTAGPVRITFAKMIHAPSGSGVILKVGMEPANAQQFGGGTGAGAGSGAASQAAGAAAPTNPPQKKLGSKPVIVIDPGHGGIDPGANGASATLEKSIVLAVGLALRDALAQTGRFDVKMTRSTDVFVSLDRRLKFSSDNAADLFISIHADSLDDKSFAQSIRGATIYTLSERASDDQARLMAEKENASDLVAGIDVSNTPGQDQVRNILIDLIKRETSNFSADFSNALAQRLVKTTQMSKDPQRSAAFKVLKQPHAPSVLVELGYLSNVQDQQNLTSAAWQKQIAQAMAGAVQTYFNKRTAEHP